MAPLASSCLPLLFLAFTIAVSAALASKTTTAVARNTKARLRCNYNGEITRLSSSRRRSTVSAPSKPRSLASFWTNEFSILYAISDGKDDQDDNSDPYLRRRSKYVDDTTDADARHFLAEYQSLASASPDRARLRMKLYVTAWPKPWWWGWTLFSAMSLLLQIFGGLSLYVWCIRSCRD